MLAPYSYGLRHQVTKVWEIFLIWLIVLYVSIYSYILDSPEPQLSKTEIS